MNNLLKHQKGDIERNKKKNKENFIITLKNKEEITILVK